MVGMQKIHSAYCKGVERISNGWEGNVHIALITLRAIKLIHDGKTEIKALFIASKENDNFSENVEFRHFRNAREKKGMPT